MLNGIMLKSLPVDWVKIKKENNFVYIYARNGIKDNASFATLRNEAIKNGVFWGAYAEFNMDWSVAQAPDKQARELAFLLQGNPGDLIPAFHLIPQNSMPIQGSNFRLVGSVKFIFQPVFQENTHVWDKS